MIELKKDFCIELKNASENIYRLTQLINTSGTHADTEYIWSDSTEKTNYILETDRYELPYRYYHAQLLNLHTEIRKAKKGFTIWLINFFISETTITKNNIKKEQIKITEYGEKKRQKITIDDFQEATEIFEDCIIDMINWQKAKKENLLIW